MGLQMDKDEEEQRIQEFVDRGNYHAAMNIALSAVNACRRENDQPGVDRFIGILRNVIQTLSKEVGSPE